MSEEPACRSLTFVHSLRAFVLRRFIIHIVTRSRGRACVCSRSRSEDALGRLAFGSASGFVSQRRGFVVMRRRDQERVERVILRSTIIQIENVVDSACPMEHADEDEEGELTFLRKRIEQGARDVQGVGSEGRVEDAAHAHTLEAPRQHVRVNVGETVIEGQHPQKQPNARTRRTNGLASGGNR